MATTAPAPVPVATLRAKPYRRFLTSALHTRFVHASALVLLVCWDHAFWLSDKRGWYLWSWFPLGPAGLKTIFLYFCSLFIFILHVANLKIGRRTTTSPFGSLQRILLSISTIQPFFWYTVSAVWFGEVYIWSSSDSAKLGWVEKGDATSSDRLNERPIYLRAIFLMIAMVQSFRFLFCDVSSLSIHIAPLSRPSTEVKSTHRIAPLQTQVQKAAIQIVTNSLLVSGPIALLGPFIYTIIFRQTMWSCHLACAKLFWNLSRANARAIGYPPSNPFLMLRSLGAGFLLVTLWDSTSFLFSSLLRQEPLKKGISLSAGSKDLNGTLLTGLKSKKDIVKSFAFWELAIVAQKQSDRRKAIFADIERIGGTCWAQMQELALGVVSDIESRITATIPRPPHKAPAHDGRTKDKAELLPHIVRSISEKSISASSPKPKTKRGMAEALLGTGMKELGQSSDPWSPPVDQIKGVILERAQPTVKAVNQWRKMLESSPIGAFFRKTNERKINMIVLGSPNSQSSIIVDAVESVTKMLSASLSEDMYGKSVAGVPTAVRTFTKTITAIETFVKANSKDVHEEGIVEVAIIFERMQDALAELLSAFQLYLSDVGLGIQELNEAKKAAEKRPLVEKATTNGHPQIQALPSQERNEKEAPEMGERREQRPQAIERTLSNEEPDISDFAKPRRLFGTRRPESKPYDWFAADVVTLSE